MEARRPARLPRYLRRRVVALTHLHADAYSITLDRRLAGAVKDLVTVAPVEALY